MSPLLAETPPTDIELYVVRPLLIVFAVGVVVSTAIGCVLLGAKRSWEYALGRLLGRRGLLVVVGVWLVSLGGGGATAAASSNSDRASAGRREAGVVIGLLAATVGTYLLAAAACYRPAGIDRLSTSWFGPLPTVPPAVPPPTPVRLTDEEQAFLAAIAASPDDDLHRLVYADWLDERGDPRGEYLRAEIDARRGDPDAVARRATLWHRVDPVWADRVTRSAT